MNLPPQSLTPLVVYGEDWPTREVLYADLDRCGMRHPLIAFRRGDAVVVKYGNQRLRWALDRGVALVPIVVVDEDDTGRAAIEHGCAPVPGDVPPGDMRVDGYRAVADPVTGDSVAARILRYVDSRPGCDEAEIAREVVVPWLAEAPRGWEVNGKPHLIDTPTWRIARAHARNLIRMGMLEAL